VIAGVAVSEFARFGLVFFPLPFANDMAPEDGEALGVWPRLSGTVVPRWSDR